MIIVVDANILFSALITPSGRLATILSNIQHPAQLVSGHYLIEELSRHHDKIVRYAKASDQDVNELKRLYLNNILLFDEAIISEKNWLEAEAMTADVDHFDVSYVALTLQTGGVLWTRDKKLSNHLRSVGFNHVMNSVELSSFLNLQ